MSYTPHLAAPGYPDERLIAVGLNARITRVLDPDYFGEPKKGGLRMWNDIAYGRGGLALPAGCKACFMLGETTGTSAGARTRKVSSCASRAPARSSRVTWPI